MGISNSQFADECGISRPTLSQLITGRNKKVSDVIITQIHKAFPSLSILWLLFGEGEMWNGEPPHFDNNSDSDTPGDGQDYLDLSARYDFEDTSEDSAEKDVENAADIPELPHSPQNGLKNAKENALKSPLETQQISKDEEIISYLKNPGFLSQIANSGAKARKVVHVTIYYDDSTFETFFPGKQS